VGVSPDSVYVGSALGPGTIGQLDGELNVGFVVFVRKFLSGGEQQMLTIARTMMGNPEILLFDEPTEGLAPHFVRLISDLVKQLKASGTAVLLSEQKLRFITPLADRVYVLESGELRLEGTMTDMAERQEVLALLAL